jgi:hypothetical protein
MQGELANGLLLLWGQWGQVGLLSDRIFPFQAAKRLQGRIPPLFEFAGDESVLRINRIILALGQPHHIAGPFQPELPALFARLAFLLQGLQRREQGCELGWLNRLKEASADGLIQIPLAKGLAGGGRIARGSLTADVARAFLTVLDLHPPPTDPTEDQSL